MKQTEFFESCIKDKNIIKIILIAYFIKIYYFVWLTQNKEYGVGRRVLHSGLIETGSFANDQRADTFHWNAGVENEKLQRCETFPSL